MNSAYENARRLAADARLLFESNRVPSAVALAVLSLEESGKGPILRGMVLAETDKEIRGAWNSYRKHTHKNVAWITGSLIAAGARTLDGLKPAVDREADHPLVLEEFKQLCVYTDCVGAGKWTTPLNVDIGDSGRYLLDMAETFAAYRDTTELELQLWKHHFMPVKSASLEVMKGALRRWYSDMAEHGLLNSYSEDTVEAFLVDVSKNSPTDVKH
jgi:AbiV family abortive infection protein